LHAISAITRIPPNAAPEFAMVVTGEPPISDGHSPVRCPIRGNTARPQRYRVVAVRSFVPSNVHRVSVREYVPFVTRPIRAEQGRRRISVGLNCHPPGEGSSSCP